MGEATAVALETLSLHKALLGVDDWRLPYTQHTAGKILLDADHLQEAEHLLEAAVIRGAKVDEIGLLDWAVFLDSYASVLHRLGNSQKAAEYGARVIEIWSKHGQPGHAALATFHANLAAYLSGAGNCMAAKAELEKALSVTETVFGPLSNDAANIHSSLSCVNTELGDHAEARRHARMAVAIGRKVLPSNHPDIGRYLMNLAAELRNDTSVNEAMKAINEALKILDSSLGESHPRTLAARKFKIQLEYRILE
jgi:tetratricopeptide (TPR) repeat protein